MEYNTKEKIVLKDYAHNSCKKCYGRGYLGADRSGNPIVCGCVKRNYRAGKKRNITEETLVKDIMRFNKL